MEIEQAFEVVASAIVAEFRIDRSRVTPAMTAADVAGWDSFSHGTLIMTLEERLGRMLPLDELLKAKDVGELADIVARTAS